MQQLIDSIKKKSFSLSHAEISYAKELQFLNDLYSKYNPASPDSILQIDRTDLLLALIHVHNLDRPFEDALEIVNETRQKLADEDNPEYIQEVTKLIVEKIDDEITGTEILLLAELDYNGYETTEALDNFIRILGYKKYRQKSNKFAEMLDNCPKKVRRQIERDSIAALKEVCNITSSMNLIDARRQELLKKAKKDSKQNNKMIASYQELIDLLKKNENHPLLALNKKLEDSLDEETLYEVLLLLLKNQEQRYLSLKKENAKLEDRNTVTGLDECLLEFGIHSDMISKSYVNFLLQKVNLQDMKNTIKDFIGLSFDINEIMNSDMVYLFQDSFKEQISQITRLYRNSIIDKELLKKNIGIFVSKDNMSNIPHEIEPLFENVYENAEILKRNKVDFGKDEYYQTSFLLERASEILENEKMLQAYQKTLSYQDGINGYLLVDDRGYDFIDFCLEQNCDPKLVDSLFSSSVLVENVIKRIMIAKTLGLDFTDSLGHLKRDILTGEGFCAKTGDLDHYIINHVPNYLNPDYARILSTHKRKNLAVSPIISKLDECCLTDDELCYDFNGTIISRNKVIRNFNVLSETLPKDTNEEDIVFNAVCYPSFLEKEQIEGIKDSLDTFYHSKDDKKIKVKK